MPRYFFHSLDGLPDFDVEGTELADDTAARTQAVIYLAELLKDDPSQVWNGHILRVEVKSETGKLLYVVFVGSESP